MSDLKDQQVGDQAEDGTEPGNAGGGDAAAIDETQDIQSTGQVDNGNEGDAGDSELPPELKEKERQLLSDYHAKTQKLAEDRRALETETSALKRDAETFQSIASEQWFKDAIKAEKERRAGVETEITEDHFEKITADRRAFQDYLANRDKSLLQKMKSEFTTLQRGMLEMRNNAELDQLSSKYEDAKELVDAGKLEKWLGKHSDMTYEEAYLLHHAKAGTQPRAISAQDAARQAHNQLTKKKTAAVEKTGVTRVDGKRIIKARSYDEAFRLAAEAVAKGEQVKVEQA